MPETVPADIAAAIDHMTRIAAAFAQARMPDKIGIAKAYDRARGDLNAAILHHLRNADEMKAALEAQTSGGA